MSQTLQASFDFFQEKKIFFHQKAQFLAQKAQQMSLGRIMVFVVGVVLAIIFANQREAWALAITVLIFSPLFMVLVKRYQTLQQQKRQAEGLKSINEDEIRRLEGNWHELSETGMHWANREHFYSADLDFFGNRSLFQYLCRAETFVGKQTLAEWLLSPAAPSEIVLRQEAVAELKTQTDFRHYLQLFGKQEDKQQSFNTETLHTLYDWLHSPNILPQTIAVRIAIYVLPLWFLTNLFLAFTNQLPFWTLLISYGLNSGLMGNLMRRMQTAEKQIRPASVLLKVLPDILELIENQDFKTQKLQTLQAQIRFEAAHSQASAYIRTLYETIELLDYKANAFFSLFFNIPFLFEWHVWKRLELQKQQMQAWLPICLDTVGQMEALNSLAGFSFAFPTLPFPNLHTEQNFGIEAIQIAHPLINPTKRVANNFKMNHLGEIMILTGANMSGKSTFLRTLGVNLAMGMAGGVVCAQSLQFAPCQLFTSMRTQDSLAEDTSSFYAELKRLKKLIELLEKHDLPIFYLLDEILKGTNSHDRQEGTKSLIKKLLAHETSGIIATHDLEISHLAQQNPDRIHNFSFNSQIEADRILFDYTLTEGVCKRFNAEKLMELMGIR